MYGRPPPPVPRRPRAKAALARLHPTPQGTSPLMRKWPCLKWPPPPGPRRPRAKAALARLHPTPRGTSPPLCENGHAQSGRRHPGPGGPGQRRLWHGFIQCPGEPALPYAKTAMPKVAAATRAQAAPGKSGFGTASSNAPGNQPPYAKMAMPTVAAAIRHRPRAALFESFS